MYTLNFVLNPQAAQRVHDFLSCLSKFSENVTIEARRNRLIFATLNSSKSAYASFTLASGRFFDSYHFVERHGRSLPSAGEDSKFAFQLRVKALSAVFRQRYQDSKGGETSIEKCEVSIDDNPSRPECRLLVKLMCRHGVLKTYKLTYEEVEVMHAIFDKELAPHRWKIRSRLMKDYMDHFGNKTEQLDISSARQRVVLTSYTEKVASGREILKQPMQTSIVLDTSEFVEYSSPDELHIGISLKDFKAIVAHADSIHGTIAGYFSTAGNPLQLHYEHEGMSCEFTLMTLVDARPSTLEALDRIIPRPGPPISSGMRPSQYNNSGNGGNSGYSRYATQEQQRMNQDGEQFDDGLGYRPQTPPGPSAPPPAPVANPSPDSSIVLPTPRDSSIRPLFLDVSDEEDEEDELTSFDHGEDGGMDQRPTLGWDTSGHIDRPSTAAARDFTAPPREPDVESTASEEEPEPFVGPTQQVSLARGLFD
ncbi:hypothetical protein RUND412_008568 [Rhizina undulata]